MDTLEQVFLKSGNARDFVKGYLGYLAQMLLRLEIDSIVRFIDTLEKARINNRTIFIVGNGGSAATASHMANDIGADVLKKSGTDKSFRIISLTDNLAVITAIANDDGYNQIFVNQLRMLYQKGDLLIAISASGNSPNVLAAAQWVKDRDGEVLALVGFDGGKLHMIADTSILVKTPKGEYGPVEDIHMVMDHLIANWFHYSITKEERSTRQEKEWSYEKIRQY